GVETIRLPSNPSKTSFTRLQELIHDYQPDKLVVGFPKNMDGSIGPRAAACKEFAEKAKDMFDIPVVLWDERLTTVAAESILLSADVSRKKRKDVIDKMAASIILQGYLDSHLQSK